MAILLCAATETEVQQTKAWIQSNAPEVEVLITGVGLMAATYSLSRYLCTNKPDWIVQAGVAGSLSAKVQACDVVQVSAECVGDLGVEETAGFQNLFVMGLADGNAYPWTNGKLSNPFAYPGIKSIVGVSINEITTRPEKLIFYRDYLGAEVESMEGAALHYVALNEKIRFLQLRAVSNIAGERDKSKWKLKEAIASLNTCLIDILPQLSKL
jgi:futalosine hydrolase